LWFRFYALYDKVYREDVLAFAYQCCKVNGGAAGVGGQGFEDIETYGVERRRDELARELKRRTYQPFPVRRVYLPKPDGGQRPLVIPAIRDQVWKRRQSWYSNRFSRRICRRNSMPIGVTVAHWTRCARSTS
jgi:retron-type reverse transcriptase